MNKPTSRRQWLTSLLRGGVLTAFAGTSVHLLRRKPEAENPCADPEGRTGCRACLEWNGCSLPRALSVKQFLQRSDEKQKS